MFYFFDIKGNESVPSFDKMMIPFLHALKDLGGTATVKELNRKTEQVMGLSEEICRAMHSAASKLTEVEYRLTWTRNYLKKAGIIVSPKPHVWSFAENFDTNKIDKTDVFEIKRQVRKERFKALESPELTNLESGKHRQLRKK